MYDLERDATAKRKLREQTEERKEQHKNVDQKRDKTEERKDQHKKTDQQRDATAKRKLGEQTEE